MLNIIGLAYRANCLVYGIDKVSEVVHTKKARLILVSSDANQKTVEKASRMPERCNALFTQVPLDANTLGEALGVETCVIACFTDVGFATSFTEKLHASDQNTYASLAEEMNARNVRAIKRKEKKLRQK